MRKTVLNTLCSACIAGILLLPAQGLAKTYKWVDEDGVTHYTSTPPPTGDFKTIKPPAKPAVDPVKAQGELQKRLEAFDKRRKEEDKTKAEASKQAADIADKKKKCEQARKNLDVLENKVRIRYTEKDGSLRFLSAEEIETNKQRARDAIKSYCKK